MNDLTKLSPRELFRAYQITSSWRVQKACEDEIVRRLELGEAAAANPREAECAARWRIGSKVPVNVYKDDKIAGQMQTPELAAEVVAALSQPCHSSMTREEAEDIAYKIVDSFCPKTHAPRNR